MFVGLEDEVVAKLCMMLTPFHVVSGSVISREGHQGQEVYIVQTGEVLISRGGTHLAVIGPGESFGEMSALGFSLGPKGNHRDKTATGQFTTFQNPDFFFKDPDLLSGFLISD